ncbi:hypothetical protein V8G54_021646 [Vigna mungo]|uniref:Uncharacterized protein n=1 Tax=Vigna mungo TaxID=3915 RepID=A0AAQ3NEJ8_VIGMU
MATAAEVPFLLHGIVIVLPPPSPAKPVFIDSGDTTNCSCRTRSCGRGRSRLLRLSSTMVSTVMTMTAPGPTLVVLAKQRIQKHGVRVDVSYEWEWRNRERYCQRRWMTLMMSDMALYCCWSLGGGVYRGWWLQWWERNQRL